MELKRDSKLVLSKLKIVDGQYVITTVPCTIEVPARFMSIGLGQVGTSTYSIGYLAIIIDKTYAVMSLTSMVELDPFRSIKVNRNGVDYYEFSFEAGDKIIKNLNVVKRDDLMFNVLDEFIFKGKIPWYLNYNDMCKLFDTAKKYGGSNVGKSQETMEFIASLVTRSKNDRSSYIRTKIETKDDITVDKIAYVPLLSVFYSVNNTMNKLSGSYFNDGVTSALVKPSAEQSHLESIVRR